MRTVIMHKLIVDSLIVGGHSIVQHNADVKVQLLIIVVWLAVLTVATFLHTDNRGAHKQ